MLVQRVLRSPLSSPCIVRGVLLDVRFWLWCYVLLCPAMLLCCAVCGMSFVA